MSVLTATAHFISIIRNFFSTIIACWIVIMIPSELFVFVSTVARKQRGQIVMREAAV